MIKMGRKWSYDIMESEGNEMVDEELRKYIGSSLREYKETKNIQNPDGEIRKIMGLFEGRKSVVDQ